MHICILLSLLSDDDGFGDPLHRSSSWSNILTPNPFHHNIILQTPLTSLTFFVWYDKAGYLSKIFYYRSISAECTASLQPWECDRAGPGTEAPHPLVTISFPLYYQIPRLLWEEIINYLLICLTFSSHLMAFYPVYFSRVSLVFVAGGMFWHKKARAGISFPCFCVSHFGDTADLAWCSKKIHPWINERFKKNYCRKNLPQSYKLLS